MAEQQGSDWRSQQFRLKVIAQIEDILRQSPSPLGKTSSEMENHVFLKAKSRDEYLALVARLILHVREINDNEVKKMKQQQAMQVNMQGGPGPGMQQANMQGGPGPGMQQANMQGGPGPGMQQANMQGGPSPGMQQDPINALQNLAMQGATGMPQQPAGMTNQQAAQMHHRIMQQQQHRKPQGPVQLQRQDAFIVTSPQPSSVQSQPLPATSSAIPFQPVPGQPQRKMPPGSFSNPPAGFGQNPVQSQQPQAAPSPAQSSQQMMSSPATMLMSPSPQSFVPSPTSRVTLIGAPSPGCAMNTPSNPSSVPSPADEQAYLDKLKQLSKYIEPLRRMINKMDRDEGTDRKKDTSKLNNLLDILSNSSKRLSMTVLLKCEQVLDKLDLQAKSTSSSAASTSSAASHAPTAKLGDQHMCQPLLDAIATHIRSPTLNHTLQRTFGPARMALYGKPIRAPSPPPKRLKRNQEKDELPNVLQGEIARLDHRFKITLDPLHHCSSNVVHLICKLDDKNLPSVPPILITVPEDYPQSCPQCDTMIEDYDATLFLQDIQQSLSNRLFQMSGQFSITSLLNAWEMSVFAACTAHINTISMF